MVCVCASARFFEAHVVTSTYRALAVRVEIDHREAAARWVGVVDLASTTIGSVLSTCLVSIYAKC